MMKLKNLAFFLAVALGLLSLAPALSLAQTSASSTVSLGAAAQKAQVRGDQEIDRRTTALNDLLTRVNAMQSVSADFKTSITTALQNQITALASLKAKIDADTDVATLKADIQSVTASYRIFALVLPQARIAAAADRVATITTMMSTLGSKLQARIQAAGSAGADVTALSAALTDIGSKLSDAQTQAQNAISGSISLQPDNGDKTVMASNTAALKASRADIQTAQQDLIAARKDVTQIIQGLKSVSANATTTPTTTTTQ